ncbi:hypothetical protein [Methylobacterium iners]|uniref:Uncharacterized protein n=1 Tax=Methylobacterium iners TaxID=418707 RepID=A0ABQ4S5B2_9HYPH|nr:hypothetical protein [Methylobacterium iners]GJD97669.1 hypothetical protein OCOJLMKI_4902 [Methylobacterium iners]
MTSPDTKVVQLFPAKPTQHILEWRRRELGYDIASLQSLSQRLQQIKAPLHEAAYAFVDVSPMDTSQKLWCALGGLRRQIEDLDAGINALISAMTSHQGALHTSSSHRG